MRYVARIGKEKSPKVELYGDNALEASQIDSFLDVGVTFEAKVGPWLYSVLGYVEHNEALV